MPVVSAQVADGSEHDRVSIVFPCQDTSVPGGWRWDEVIVDHSDIDGYGLRVRYTDSLDWTNLGKTGPVHIPLIGRETELQSKEDAEIMARVLQGHFLDFAFREIIAPPEGTVWVTDGVFVEPTEMKVLPAECRTIRPDETILQVDAGELSDGQCRYLLLSGTLKLLHIPPHIFTVLRSHQHHHHCDRHFATHVSATRSPSRIPNHTPSHNIGNAT